MKLTTKTEYALISLKYLCEHSNAQPISVAEVSEGEKLPQDYVGQIFVRLRKAGIIKSVKGVYGGFALSRDPSQITLKQLIEAVEGRTFEIFCTPRLRERIVCGHFSCCSVRPVWRKLKRLIDQFCESITLETLLKDEGELEAELNLNAFGEELVNSVEVRKS